MKAYSRLFTVRHNDSDKWPWRHAIRRRAAKRTDNQITRAKLKADLRLQSQEI